MMIDQQILSDITVHMKYAKFKPELYRRETWEELVTRNMNMHIKKFPDLSEDIKWAYQYVYDKKVLPSMRSLQFGGKPIEITPSRIYNCAYAPVDNIAVFSEAMFLLLGGTGFGYSVQRHHVDKLPDIKKTKRAKRFLIGDSIEGWAQAVDALIKSYFLGKAKPNFDFNDIRQKGSILVTSGGKAPGPEPLKDCLHNIEKILDRKEIGSKLTTVEAHDIMCYIADAVLAGGIRRAALISLFSIDDEDMLTCKFGNWWELNPQRGRANNSAVVVRHRVKYKDFKNLWDKVKASGSGEPGIYFTNNAEWGTNPCAEIALRANQFCNLCELNGSDVESFEDFMNRIKASTIIGTLQASYSDFHLLRDIWKETTEKERLLGIGITGIASNSIHNEWLKAGAEYAKELNQKYAEMLGIEPAARVTTVSNLAA